MNIPDGKFVDLFVVKTKKNRQEHYELWGTYLGGGRGDMFITEASGYAKGRLIHLLAKSFNELVEQTIHKSQEGE